MNHEDNDRDTMVRFMGSFDDAINGAFEMLVDDDLEAFLIATAETSEFQVRYGSENPDAEELIELTTAILKHTAIQTDLTPRETLRALDYKLAQEGGQEP